MKNSLRIERARHSMTQADLAESIGVSRQTIFAIESSKYVPSAVLVLKLGRLFQKPVEELFELEDED